MRAIRESLWRAGPVCLPAASTDLADCGSHLLRFAVPGQWGLWEGWPTHPSASSFVDYPKYKPFINSDLQHSPEKPVIPYPESNSRGNSLVQHLLLWDRGAM
uniref:Uncharacterized protein n=1 Tax=Chelonoidis abingdonii TaxID=106734 RepID=A0A8C0JDG5_CHEAB